MNILMTLIFWLVLGGIAGWLAGAVMGVNASLGFMSTVALGIAGAFVGALLFNVFGGASITGINLYSILVAMVGSIALIGIARATGQTRQAS